MHLNLLSNSTSPCFEVFLFSVMFYFRTSNQISLSFRSLDHLTQSKAKRKKEEELKRAKGETEKIRISVIRPTFASLMLGRSSNLTRQN